MNSASTEKVVLTTDGVFQTEAIYYLCWLHHGTSIPEKIGLILLKVSKLVAS